MSGQKVTIVHDYLHQFGGAEKVVEAWLKIYPRATVFSTIFTPETFKNSKVLTKAYQEGRIKTTFLQWFLPVFKKFFKHFFWLYPIVMSFYRVKNQDLVIISATYCGKNIKLKNCPNSVFYCNTPTRFLHGLMTEVDRKTLPTFYLALINLVNPILKKLDLRAVKYLHKQKVKFISNSKNIQDLFKKIYGFNSEVVYPPVETKKFLKLKPSPTSFDDNSFYFSFGRISFHKRIDLAIKACQKLKRPLIVAGASAFQAEMDKLQFLIDDFEKNNPHFKDKIKLVGRISDQDLQNYLKICRGFLFPGREDFGIAPVEVLASGKPVIAYGSGGALEYIKEEKNGFLFPEQTVDNLCKTILKFEQKKNWDIDQIKKTCIDFDTLVFEKKFREYL